MQILKLKIVKIIIYPILFTIGVFFSLNIEAQPHTSALKKDTSAQKKAQPKQTLSSATDSLKLAINDAKTSFNTLVKVHRDTTTIMISNIDYEDSNLNILKENLKKIKGVKAISLQYKSSTVLLKIPFKGKPTDLWDQLASSSKRPFKLVEANENSILLEFKK